MCGPPFRRVRARQLHQVDHLVVLGPPDPEPRASVRELGVGPVIVDREAQDALVELERLLQVLNEQPDVVDRFEERLLLLRGAASRAGEKLSDGARRGTSH